MRITLSVLLATLTIYCSATVLSLPRSLIATAASLARHHARQQRGSRHSNDGTAEAAAASLLQMRMWPSAAAEVRSKKDAAGFVLDGRNIATNSYTDTGTDTDTTGDDIDRLSDSYELVTTNNHNNNHNNAGFKQAHPYQLVSGKLADVKDVVAHATSGNRKLPTEYDLNALLASAADTLAWQRAARAQQTTQQKPESQTWLQAPRIRAMQMKELFTPLKYWAHHCQPPDRNCPREYYRALLADSRSRAAAAAAKQMDDFTSDAEYVGVIGGDDDVVNMNGQAYHFGKSDSGGGFDVDMLTNINDDATVDNVYNIAAELANAGSVVDGSRHIGINDEEAAAAEAEAEDEDNNADNDILMLLNGEQDVMKFLSWAMQQLYTYQHLAQLSNGSGRAESYHPGMFNWKKLNLSGHLEPPLSVEEPQYVIVRREQLDEDLTSAPQYKDDPFIPPRGRKHNLPDLDALLNRYETFVPNRGKRDKIKDIFKYDDLFFPNRGKKQKPPKAVATTPQRAFNEEAIGLNSVDSAIDDAEGEKGKQLLDNHVDGNDDSNLTAPPVTNAMRRVLGELDKRLRWRQSRNCSTLVNVYGGAREDCDNEDDDDGDEAVDTLRIGIDKNSDDNSNNYSDTIDSNVVMPDDGAGSGEGVAEAIAIVAALNENDHSPVKSSLLQIDTRDAMSDVVMTTKRPTVGWRGTNMYSRLRRVPSTYGGATRIAANRLRSLLSSATQSVQRQQMNRATNQQKQQQQTSMKATPRYHGRQLRQEQVQQEQHHQQQRLQLQKKQAQRRASWLMALPSNQVRVNTNDLEALTWRQLQRKPQQQQQKQLDNNKPLTVQHPALAWLQHLPVQKTESQQQIQHGLFGSSGVVNGAAAERKPLESTDHIYFNI